MARRSDAADAYITYLKSTVPGRSDSEQQVANWAWEAYRNEGKYEDVTGTSKSLSAVDMFHLLLTQLNLMHKSGGLLVNVHPGNVQIIRLTEATPPAKYICDFPVWRTLGSMVAQGQAIVVQDPWAHATPEAEVVQSMLESRDNGMEALKHVKAALATRFTWGIQDDYMAFTRMVLRMTQPHPYRQHPVQLHEYMEEGVPLTPSVISSTIIPMCVAKKDVQVCKKKHNVERPLRKIFFHLDRVLGGGEET